jgi:hypothetical protein
MPCCCPATPTAAARSSSPALPGPARPTRRPGRPRCPADAGRLLPAHHRAVSRLSAQHDLGGLGRRVNARDEHGCPFAPAPHRLPAGRLADHPRRLPRCQPGRGWRRVRVRRASRENGACCATVMPSTSGSPPASASAARRHRGWRRCLTGDWHAAEDLVQASAVRSGLYRAWPALDAGADGDAYLRRIMVTTHRSWWRARWRRETPAAVLPGAAGADSASADPADQQALAALVRQARRPASPGSAGRTRCATSRTCQ